MTKETVDLSSLKDFLSFTASFIGHECDRHVGYQVLGYEHGEMDKKKTRRFKAGHMHEKAVLEEMREDGVKFTHSVLDKGGQKELMAEIRLGGNPKFYVIAHPDGIYGGEGLDERLENGSPIEIKGLNHFFWSRIHGPKTIPVKYYVQLQMQILAAEKDTALFNIRDRDSGESKRWIVYRDQDRINKILKRLAIITNTILLHKTAPDASWEPGWDGCKKPFKCPFLETCLRDHGITDRLVVDDLPVVIDVDDKDVMIAAVEYCFLRDRIKALKVRQSKSKTTLKNTLSKFNSTKMAVGAFFCSMSSPDPKKIPDKDKIKQLMDEGTLDFEEKDQSPRITVEYKNPNVAIDLKQTLKELRSGEDV